MARVQGSAAALAEAGGARRALIPAYPCFIADDSLTTSRQSIRISRTGMPGCSMRESIAHGRFPDLPAWLVHRRQRHRSRLAYSTSSMPTIRMSCGIL